MPIPRYAKVELEWYKEELQRHKNFREWVKTTHPEVLKDYDNYILVKTVTKRQLLDLRFQQF